MEVFTRLRTENPGVLHFDFSNLSPTGIWFDSLSIEVKARSPQGFEKASHRHPVRTIVPAFESRSTKCHGDIHYAFKKAINGGEYYAGWLNVRANYRVHGKEQHSEWHKYWIEVGPVVITRLSSEKPNT